MRLELTDEQALFQETTVRFIDTELPLTATRALHDDAIGFDRAWLRKCADLGWFAMLVGEDDGGGSVSGSGVIDAALIAEQVGRHVQPGPFVPMNVVASAIARTGSAKQRAEHLPAIVGGDVVATWAFTDEQGTWDLGSGVVARREHGKLVLAGMRGGVQDGAAADVILVVATLDGSPVQVLVSATAPGLTIRPLESLDLSRRFAHVTFDHVTVDEGALLPCDWATLEAQLNLAVVLNLADTVGAIDALFAMTVAYAKDRIAFGRPIGSFQALKHVLADQALYVETCKAGAVAAADGISEEDTDATEMVSAAAAYIGDVANDVAQECLQVHGGIGYTWEHDLHLYLRRLRSNSALYGEPMWHRERICRFFDRAAMAV